MNVKNLKKMIKPTKLNEELKQKLCVLKNMAEEKNNKLKEYPTGKIQIKKSNGRTQYRLKLGTDKPEKYISKKDNSTIKKYLQKAYDIKIKKILQKEIKNIEAYLKKSEENQKQIREEYSKKPDEVKYFIDPIDCSDEDYIKCWISEQYESKVKQIPDTEYKTDKGEFVRSKSELTIANYLFKRDIPYKYERPLMLFGGSIVHPDFTVLDIKNRREIYWEHRGMMDDVEYAKKTVKKTKEYSRNNIVLGINLIITEETSTSPLGTNEIETIVKTYFK